LGEEKSIKIYNLLKVEGTRSFNDKETGRGFLAICSFGNPKNIKRYL